MHCMSDTLAFMIADTSRLLRRSFDERTRAIGITGAQWRLLFTVSRNEGQNQGATAELLEVEPITLCRMIDRMEESGMVERRPDPNDRRAWRLYLTDKSRPLIGQLRELGDQLTEQALQGVAADDRQRLRDILNTIRTNLSAGADQQEATHG